MCNNNKKKILKFYCAYDVKLKLNYPEGKLRSKHLRTQKWISRKDNLNKQELDFGHITT